MDDGRADKRRAKSRSSTGKPSRKREKPREIVATGRLLEVQQFAEVVKEFATDVQTFYERRAEDRLVNENLQTRFKNGLVRMREDSLVALRVFRGLTKAAKEHPGKDAQDAIADKVINALRRGGCEARLESIQKQHTRVINRLDKPLNATEARNILDDVRQLWVDARSLGNFANAIQRNIRHAILRARSGGAPTISPDIQKRLEAVEDATRRFIEMVSKQPRTSGLHGKAITEWLQAFVNRSIAALAGNPAMSSIVADIKDAPWGYLNIRTVSHTIVILGNYDSALLFLRLSARRFGRLLHRILQRCGSLFEVRIRHLQIMFLCDSLRVADPSTNNVDRERLRQFRFSRAA